MRKTACEAQRSPNSPFGYNQSSTNCTYFGLSGNVKDAVSLFVSASSSVFRVESESRASSKYVNRVPFQDEWSRAGQPLTVLCLRSLDLSPRLGSCRRILPRSPAVILSQTSRAEWKLHTHLPAPWQFPEKAVIQASNKTKYCGSAWTD